MLAVLVALGSFGAAPPPQAAAAGSGGLVGNLLPRPPSSVPKLTETAEDKQPHVWILHEGKPERVMLKTGMTDGVMTEVKEGKLETDTAVIVDVIEAKK